MVYIQFTLCMFRVCFIYIIFIYIEHTFLVNTCTPLPGQRNRWTINTQYFHYLSSSAPHLLHRFILIPIAQITYPSVVYRCRRNSILGRGVGVVAGIIARNVTSSSGSRSVNGAAVIIVRLHGSVLEFHCALFAADQRKRRAQFISWWRTSINGVVRAERHETRCLLRFTQRYCYRR